MHLLDTQIISYGFKEDSHWGILGQGISSVTAREFLLVQGQHRTKANYYVPLPQRLRMEHFSDDSEFLKLEHRFSKSVTDQVIINFGRDYPAMIEYGNLAIAEIVNTKAKRLFDETIRFLDKRLRKTISRRFRFLLDSDIICIPLNRNSIELGLNLFGEFRTQYTSKANIRNTINDVFILATAVSTSTKLITKDSLLNRFATAYYGGDVKANSDLLTIDFSKDKDSTKPGNRESKGYINRGWQYRIKNYPEVYR
jgi:predicted nucleic acid-binding protein